MPAFDLIVLGCGGGPDEANLSSYALKLHRARWSDGIVSLEAGSGIGSIRRLLEANPALFDAPGCTAADVLSWIRCYLITHAHMDHISGLVLTTAAMSGPARRVHAVHQTLKDIESVFSDRLWPNLGSWQEGGDRAALIYSELRIDGQYTPIAPSISVRTMPLCHGKTRADTTYDSTAFFVRDDGSGQELLFFGDVAPDRLSQHPRTLAVWRVAAHKIPHVLSTIFIECSYPLGRPDHMLHGHLNPEHLALELAALASEVAKVKRVTGPTNTSGAQQRKGVAGFQHPAEDLRGALRGVRVYVTHCKDDLVHAYEQPINLVIASQLRALLEPQGFGVEVLAAKQGAHISI